jgi:hypothetical protein
LLAEARRRADLLTAERLELIAQITDELIGHAGAARGHAEQMVAALERTLASLDVEPGAPAPGRPPL